MSDIKERLRDGNQTQVMTLRQEAADYIEQLEQKYAALEVCAGKYIQWLGVENFVEGLDSDMHDVDVAGDTALSRTKE